MVGAAPARLYDQIIWLFASLSSQSVGHAPTAWMNQLLKAKVTGPLVEKIFDRVTSREIFILPLRAGGCFCSFVSFLGGVARWADGITISVCGARIVVEGRAIRTYSCLTLCYTKFSRADRQRSLCNISLRSLYTRGVAKSPHRPCFLRLESDWWPTRIPTLCAQAGAMKMCQKVLEGGIPPNYFGACGNFAIAFVAFEPDFKVIRRKLHIKCC